MGGYGGGWKDLMLTSGLARIYDRQGEEASLGDDENRFP